MKELIGKQVKGYFEKGYVVGVLSCLDGVYTAFSFGGRIQFRDSDIENTQLNDDLPIIGLFYNESD